MKNHTNLNSQAQFLTWYGREFGEASKCIRLPFPLDALLKDTHKIGLSQAENKAFLDSLICLKNE